MEILRTSLDKAAAVAGGSLCRTVQDMAVVAEDTPLVLQGPFDLLLGSSHSHRPGSLAELECRSLGSFIGAVDGVQDLQALGSCSNLE